ncbi:MAG TPA: hypothetical protein VFQ61_00405 [Polyangiaceae bacterium]|nr:hypothetical protein [Polyangiaceae bacterium]
MAASPLAASPTGGPALIRIAGTGLPDAGLPDEPASVAELGGEAVG